MPPQFPSPSLAKRLAVGTTELLSELRGAVDPHCSPVGLYIEHLFERLKARWVAKHGEGVGASDEDAALRNTETVCRYIQINLYRALRRDPANRASKIPSQEILCGHAARLAFEPPYPRDWRINTVALVPLAEQHLGEVIPLARVMVTLKDLTVARLWFSGNAPLRGETTWELYKRYDPEGERAMHLGHFYTVLPKSWRELAGEGGAAQYQYIGVPYKDCKALESWCASQSLTADGASVEELLQRYDPLRAAGLRASEFYNLLPADWRRRLRG